MEILINIKFTSPKKDTKFWEALLAGLCDEKRGAWLEEQFEYFGEAAAEAITALMNACEECNDYVVFESYACNNNQLETCMNAGWGAMSVYPK